MGMISIGSIDASGSFAAYRADPVGAARAAVVVIQEIFGVNAGIRRKCDRLAEQGYLALAPDLFRRFAPNLELDPDVPAELERAFELRHGFDPEAGIRDIEATIRHARGFLPAAGKVGVVGYCLGGRMAFMAATRTDSDASVGYYGAGIDALLGEAHAISRPLMLHFAGDDHFIGPDVREKVGQALSGNPKVVIHLYPGVDHGFATEYGRRRDETAADLADDRTAAFLAEYLA
jgi:carboxymethylenebutenolidase